MIYIRHWLFDYNIIPFYLNVLFISFRENAVRLSQLMHDELMPVKDIGAYWIEHVLRHKGTRHLQLAGRDLPFYQTYLIDVIAFLIAISVIFLLLTIILLRWILSKCLHRSVPSTSINVKRKTQ